MCEPCILNPISQCRYSGVESLKDVSEFYFPDSKVMTLSDHWGNTRYIVTLHNGTVAACGCIIDSFDNIVQVYTRKANRRRHIASMLVYWIRTKRKAHDPVYQTEDGKKLFKNTLQV